MSIDAAIDAIIRLADAAERIAGALESREAQVQGFAAVGLGATLAAASAPAIDGLEKPKRPRRTKAEMEAARAAEEQAQAIVQPAPAAAPVAPPAGDELLARLAQQQAAQQQQMSPQMAAVMSNAAAAIAAPAPVAPMPPMPQPPAPAVPVVADPFDGYMDMAPQQQFTKFLELVGPHFNIPSVRDAVVSTVESVGLTLPLSSPGNRAAPNEAYVDADPNTRFLIYFQAHKAIEAAKAAARPSTGL